MTTAAKALLYYLRRYLDANPSRVRPLVALVRKTTGKPFERSTLWRHLRLVSEPFLSVSMVYLSFLHRAGAIAPGKKGQGLFVYTRPEIAKRKATK